MQGEELQQYFHYLHNELKVPFKGGLDQKEGCSILPTSAMG